MATGKASAMRQIQHNGILAWAALLSVLVFIFVMLTLDDFRQINEQRYDYLRKQTLLSRLNALPSEEEAIQEQLEALSIEASSRFLFSGEKNAVESQMQRDIRKLVGLEDLTVTAMRPLGNPRQSGKLSKSLIQISFAADHGKLVSFLERLEGWEPLLRVNRLSIRVRRAATATTAAELAVSLEIAGFRLAQGERS